MNVLLQKNPLLNGRKEYVFEKEKNCFVGIVSRRIT